MTQVLCRPHNWSMPIGTSHLIQRVRSLGSKKAVIAMHVTNETADVTKKLVKFNTAKHLRYPAVRQLTERRSVSQLAILVWCSWNGQQRRLKFGWNVACIGGFYIYKYNLNWRLFFVWAGDCSIEATVCVCARARARARVCVCVCHCVCHCVCLCQTDSRERMK